MSDQTQDLLRAHVRYIALYDSLGDADGAAREQSRIGRTLTRVLADSTGAPLCRLRLAARLMTATPPDFEKEMNMRWTKATKAGSSRGSC